ncbi:MAG: endonuclease/exonuclease/phosphatase family protein [Bifidobacterium sp.]|nr:endonuclease/exonuclease/phosphatase family protein [Bifidobacterium sp.]
MGFTNRRHRVLGAIAGLLALVALLGCAARLRPVSLQKLPWVPVVIAATPWFAAVAAVALVLALISRRWVVAIVSCLCIAVQVYWQMPFFRTSNPLDSQAIAAAATGDTSDNVMRVMTANVYKGQADPQAIVDLVREQHVEVLTLQETTPEFVERLEADGLKELLPYDEVSSSEHSWKRYGNGLWSARPMRDVVAAEFDSVASFMPAGTVDVDDGTLPVRFVSVHTTSPNPGTWDMWSQSIGELSQLTAKKDTRYVLMGDFNATADHAVFREVLGDGYQDAVMADGHGFVFTWPMDRKYVAAGTDLDHIIVGKDTKVGQVEAATIPGSDHRALLATLEFPGR